MKKMKRPDWGLGITIPEDFDAETETYVRLAYETGVRQGRQSVSEAIIGALSLDDRFEPSR